MSDHGRNGGTVWASFDGGLTWPVKRLVDPGAFAYSSMAAGRAGTPTEGMIYLFYEGESLMQESSEELRRPNERTGNIARFNLAWVTQGRDWREFLPE